ncbi:MAG: segregation/condensation protein A, partial [Candidatus Aenigmatarchaeota archaeon]
MLDEEKILELIQEDPDWEETIVYIIMEKGMDPWDIDIVKLANVFSNSLQKMEKFDFKVPARLIIISAILLRMKVEIMVWEKNEGKKMEDEEEIEEMNLDVDISEIPDMDVPAKRKPKRKVTLNELTEALGKAFRTQNLRKDRKKKFRKRVQNAVPKDDKEDIEKRIDDLYGRITQTLDDLKNNRITFSSLVPDWNRKEIVSSFLPLLHLNG